jgi:transposase-like protein
MSSRWPDGFHCPRCGGQTFYMIESRKQLQCQTCGKQTSITAGTVMHSTKTPLRVWFHAAYLVTTLTPGISAVQLHKQLGVSYEKAFMMLHKLRAAMVKEGRERLRGIVEVDATYIGGLEEDLPGRAKGLKALVVGAVEAREKSAGRVRLRRIESADKATLEKFIKENVEPGAEVRTDGWSGYNGLSALGYRHLAQIEGEPERATVILPHVHRGFANLKTWILGTHHGAISWQHLPAYLNEFTFRYNRRRTPMAAFQTVLGLADERRGPTYDELYKVARGESDYAHPNPAELRDREYAENTR